MPFIFTGEPLKKRNTAGAFRALPPPALARWATSSIGSTSFDSNTSFSSDASRRSMYSSQENTFTSDTSFGASSSSNPPPKPTGISFTSATGSTSHAPACESNSSSTASGLLGKSLAAHGKSHTFAFGSDRQASGSGNGETNDETLRSMVDEASALLSAEGDPLRLFRANEREDERMAKCLKTGADIYPAWDVRNAAKGVLCDCPSSCSRSRVEDTKEAGGRQLELPTMSTDARGFMDLSAELRNTIYQFALTPGYISLRSCVHHCPSGVEPRMAVSLLATSRQVRREAAAFLFDNTFIVNACLNYGDKPVIHNSQLPPAVLPKIKFLSLVIDFTRLSPLPNRLADWRPLQQMTNLRSLRIMAFNRLERGWPAPIVSRELQNILERIPKTCMVAYGADSADEEDHFYGLAEKVGELLEKKCCELCPEHLAREAERVEEDIVKGLHSGEKGDFRFERISGSFQPLG